MLKQDNIGENDLGNILSETKKILQKPQRRIIISLASMEDTARLKALQEKVWIWNEEEVNALFNLFDKPNIVK